MVDAIQRQRVVAVVGCARGGGGEEREVVPIVVGVIAVRAATEGTNPRVLIGVVPFPGADQGAFIRDAVNEGAVGLGDDPSAVRCPVLDAGGTQGNRWIPGSKDARTSGDPMTR